MLCLVLKNQQPVRIALSLRPCSEPAGLWSPAPPQRQAHASCADQCMCWRRSMWSGSRRTAISRARRPKLTRSFRKTWLRRRCMAGGWTARGPATAPPSRTRLCALLTRPPTRCCSASHPCALSWAHTSGKTALTARVATSTKHISTWLVLNCS